MYICTAKITVFWVFHIFLCCHCYHRLLIVVVVVVVIITVVLVVVVMATVVVVVRYQAGSLDDRIQKANQKTNEMIRNA